MNGGQEDDIVYALFYLLPPYCFETRSLNLELGWHLRSLPTPSSCLHSLQCWAYRQAWLNLAFYLGAEVWTQVLRFVQWALLTHWVIVLMKFCLALLYFAFLLTYSWKAKASEYLSTHYLPSPVHILLSFLSFHPLSSFSFEKKKSTQSRYDGDPYIPHHECPKKRDILLYNYKTESHWRNVTLVIISTNR